MLAVLHCLSPADDDPASLISSPETLSTIPDCEDYRGVDPRPPVSANFGFHQTIVKDRDLSLTEQHLLLRETGSSLVDSEFQAVKHPGHLMITLGIFDCQNEVIQKAIGATFHPESEDIPPRHLGLGDISSRYPNLEDIPSPGGGILQSPNSTQNPPRLGTGGNDKSPAGPSDPATAFGHDQNDMSTNGRKNSSKGRHNENTSCAKYGGKSGHEFPDPFYWFDPDKYGIYKCSCSRGKRHTDFFQRVLDHHWKAGHFHDEFGNETAAKRAYWSATDARPTKYEPQSYDYRARWYLALLSALWFPSQLPVLPKCPESGEHPIYTLIMHNPPYPELPERSPHDKQPAEVSNTTIDRRVNYSGRSPSHGVQKLADSAPQNVAVQAQGNAQSQQLETKAAEQDVQLPYLHLNISQETQAIAELRVRVKFLESQLGYSGIPQLQPEDYFLWNQSDPNNVNFETYSTLSSAPTRVNETGQLPPKRLRFEGTAANLQDVRFISGDMRLIHDDNVE